jgi:hypothetical protein
MCRAAAREEDVLSPISDPGPALEDTHSAPGRRHAIDLAPVKDEAQENAGRMGHDFIHSNHLSGIRLIFQYTGKGSRRYPFLALKLAAGAA